MKKLMQTKPVSSNMDVFEFPESLVLDYFFESKSSEI